MLKHEKKSSHGLEVLVDGFHAHRKPFFSTLITLFVDFYRVTQQVLFKKLSQNGQKTTQNWSKSSKYCSKLTQNSHKNWSK